MTQVGFIGAGRMGGGMIRTLLKAGYDVVFSDPDPGAATALSDTDARFATTIDEVASGSEFVCTSVPLPEHLEHLYAPSGPLLGALGQGTVSIDFSTVDVQTAVRVGTRIGGAGAEFVACPLGGGPAQAVSGELKLFPGGSSDALGRSAALLAVLGTVTPMGSVEAAVSFKLICNLVGMTNVAVLAEAFAMGQKAGIDPEHLGVALESAGAGSHQLKIRWSSFVEDDHTARFPVELAIKDLRLAVQVAAQWGVPLTVGSNTLQSLLTARAHGFGSSDVTAMVKNGLPDY